MVAGADVAPLIRDGHIHGAPTVPALSPAGAAELIASPLHGPVGTATHIAPNRDNCDWPSNAFGWQDGPAAPD